MVDETCLPLGSPCTTNDECLGTNCGDTPAGRYCTQPCDPLRPNLGCPPGLFCAWVSGCDGVCVPEPDGARTLGIGESCSEDAQCTSLFCIDPGDGRQRCLQSCRSGDGMCLAGEACAAGLGTCGGCVDEEILRAERALGEPCDIDDDCISDVCIDDGGITYCSAPCGEGTECVSGFHCREGACVRGDAQGVGGGCLVNDDCTEGNFCATRGDTHWCSTFCGEGREECPESFSCVDVGEGSSVCAPDRRLIGEECEADEDCVTETCDLATGTGVCTRLCSFENPCPPGFECARTEDGTEATCRARAAPATSAPAGGGCGCAIVGRGGRWSGWLGSTILLAFFILVYGRRR
jgi:hypothetical protein